MTEKKLHLLKGKEEAAAATLATNSKNEESAATLCKFLSICFLHVSIEEINKAFGTFYLMSMPREIKNPHSIITARNDAIME